ncbi:MAG: lipase family protein [Pseudomonadota bacterium]
MKHIVHPHIARLAAAALTALVVSACGDSPVPAGGLVPNPGGPGMPTSPPGNSSLRAPSLPTPDPDPFYAQPASFSGTVPGQVLASRPITFAPSGVAMSNEAWHLKYVSRDVNGQPIAAVATVIKPTTPGTGAPVLLSYQFPINGLGLQCSASHAMEGSTVNSTIQLETANLLVALQAGYIVVTPDHLGPFSAYGTPRLAGQITLDGIRAALNYAPLGLSSTTLIGAWGYSGGANATAWAAVLQQEYAPELKLVAFATGGTPADGISIARAVDENPVTNAGFFSLVLSAILGTNRSYPGLVTPILNARGLATAESLKDGCGGGTSDGSAEPTGKLADYTTSADPFNEPGVIATQPFITLPLAGATPITDTFVYHSQIDELIPISGADAMVAAWCRDGAHVSYFRGVAGEHVAFQAATSPNVLAYLASRFAGSPVAVTPPGTTVCN